MRRLAVMTMAMLAVAAAPPMPDDAADALYLERFRDIATSGRGELSRYDPLEAVPGAADATPLAAVKPTEHRVTAEALTAVRTYAAANRSSALIVWHKGRIDEAAYFGGTTRETPIVSKSLAKPLTAIVVGRALALGKIASLDQSVADFVPSWRGTPKAAIRVRHLLDMRSGLLAQGISTDPANPWSRAYLHPNHEAILTGDYPLTDPPGTLYEYSNATSELVAVLIEAATGRRYAEFVSTELLKPLGAMGGSVWLNRPGGVAHSGCCIMLPAETWVRIAALLLHDGVWAGRRLLPAGYVTAMRTGTTANPNYGLGVWLGEPYRERRGFANAARPGPKILQSVPFTAADTFMFDGNSNQIVYIVPSRDLIVLRVGDSPPKEPEWDNSYLLNTVLAGLTTRR